MEDVRATRREESLSACPHLPPVAGYEILDELGRGGMGVVYRARQLGLNRVVALKMIPSADATCEDFVRFRAEAHAVARLSHPGIVPIYDVGEHDGMPFYTMEFLGGGNLEQLLARRRIGPREAAALVEQLARAADHAHRHGVLHRDLKPANVLLQIADCRLQIGNPPRPPSPQSAILNLQSAIPKLADFGLARRLDGSGHHTRTGAILGTPSYMAPEQALGRRDQGPAVDVWSLGAILYECLTGRTAFSGTSVLHTLELVRGEDPQAPRTLDPAVPRELETVALRCLEKDPASRYASAADLADDLRRWLDGEPV
ncbi:MAG: serine/threonine-protein kinase, partial [Gemmataceae bacterium]